jgi:lipopolysaccharide biosynthesis regulator YciM
VREFRGDLEGPDGAKAAYLAARPSRAALAEALQELPPEQAENASRLYARMKEDATYWLGVLTLGEGEYAAAVDYLGRMTLQAAPDSRWTDAARTNLARAYIGLGRTDEAVRILRADDHASGRREALSSGATRSAAGGAVAAATAAAAGTADFSAALISLTSPP